MKATKGTTRRKYLVRATLLAGTGVMTTLTGITAIGVAPASASGSTVTLQFWNAYNTTDKEASTMQNVVLKKFEAENPRYQGPVGRRPLRRPRGEIHRRRCCRQPAGLAPLRYRLGTLSRRRRSAARPEQAEVGQVDLGGALPGPLSTNLYDGNYYGVPDDTNTQVFFWNKADFAAANIAGPPTTLAQVWTDAAALTNTSKGQFGLGVDGTDIWNVAPYIWSNGGNFTNSSWTTTTGYMNGTATEAAIQELVNLDKAGDIGSDLVGGSGSVSGETAFPKGEYAMYIDGPWAYPTYAAEKFTTPADYGMELMPSGPGGTRLDGRWRGPRHRQGRAEPARRREIGHVPHRLLRAAPDGQPGRPGRPTRQTRPPRSSSSPTSASSSSSS